MSNQHEKTEFELIKELFINWLRHWYYFVISLVVCGALGILYMKVATPQYQVSAKVLVRKDDAAGGLSEMPLMKSLGFGLGKGGGLNIEDESNVICSQGNVKKMISHLQLNNIYTLSEFAGFYKTDLFDETPLEVTYPESLPDTLRALIKFSVSVRGDQLTAKVKADKENIGTYKLDNLPADISTPYGTFTFNKTAHFNEYGNSYNLIILVLNLDYQAQIYRELLEIEPEKKSSDIIHLNLKDFNIKRAKMILNDLIQTHNQIMAKEKELVGGQTIQFVTNRLEQVGRDLDSVDMKIRDFKEVYKLTDPSADAEAYLDQGTELMPKLIEARSQLEMTKVLDDFISDPKNANSPIPLSSMISSEAIGQAIILYNKEQARWAETFESSKKSTPVSQSLSSQLNSTRESLLSALRNSREALTIAVKKLQEKQNELDSRFKDFPVIEKKFVALKREQEIQQAVYLFLQQKKEESSVTSVSVMPRLRVVDEPYALIKPVSPSFVKTFLVVFFFGGVLIPVTAIYLKPRSQASRKKK